MHRAVIGAGYGDEGKGLLTDAFAAMGASLVVRANGGAQAGHTVTTPDGRRHVFHHYPSGALAGVPGHLGRRFVCHPMMLASERASLAALGGRLDLSADPRAAVTTPWDMMVNQIAERSRGGTRHGSCGLGFGETVERDGFPEFALRVGDLARGDTLDRLVRIRRDWLPLRLERLGLSPTQDESDLIANDAILERFADDLEGFVGLVDVRQDASLGTEPGLLFEGAQGLMLDQDYGSFPHVTRSYTGIRNVAEILGEAGIERIEVTYATRAYVTRHGAGPLAGETDRAEGFDVIDRTNVPNPWQGAIRYAPLDIDVLSDAILNDLDLAGGVRIDAQVAVTCMDQATGAVPLAYAGRIVRGSVLDLATRVTAILPGRGLHSMGPTRDTLVRPSGDSLAAA